MPLPIASGLGIELVYSFIIIVCSLVIYFVTKELYELSSHEGIKYFRLTFLFFAIAYFFRSFIKILLHSFNAVEVLDISYSWIFARITLFAFMYFSSMAIFYLLYSVVWKQGHEKRIYLFHGLALLIAVLSILTKNMMIRLGIHGFLLLFVLYLVYHSYNGKNKPLFGIYVLLLLFWILNILDILVPNFLRTFQLFVYAASVLIFVIIVYKVIRIVKRGNNHETGKT